MVAAYPWQLFALSGMLLELIQDVAIVLLTLDEFEEFQAIHCLVGHDGRMG